MTEPSREALRLALEALKPKAHLWAIECYKKGLSQECDIDGARANFDAAISAIETEFAKPQTPYGWDEKALEVARAIVNSREPNHTRYLAKAQLAVLDAMRWARPADHIVPPMDLLHACKEAAKWLEGWASAEPYLTLLHDAIARAEAKAASAPSEPVADDVAPMEGRGTPSLDYPYHQGQYEEPTFAAPSCVVLDARPDGSDADLLRLWHECSGSLTDTDAAGLRRFAEALARGVQPSDAELARAVMLLMDRQGVTKLVWGDMAALAQTPAGVMVDYGFHCYSCGKEWEDTKPTSDCPAPGCGTTNNHCAANPRGVKGPEHG